LILEAAGDSGLLMGIDRDMEAIAEAESRLARFGNRFRAVNGSFADMAAIARSEGIEQFDGILLDLGVSSHQLDCAERGFSFRADGPLDMRMNRTEGTPASDLVNSMSGGELERIIKEYGEERWAKRIAERIVEARRETPFETTLQLAALIERAIPKKFHEDRIHPATRTFQALRIAVNGELEQLEAALKDGIGLLKSGGRMVVISFHSLEDRMVKHAFREAATGCTCPRHLPLCVCGHRPVVKVITGRPSLASEEERTANPRSRSAKTRAAEKL